MEASDSSHSGIVAGVIYWRPRVGLAGAEAAKRGCRKDCRVALARESQSGFRFEPLDVGEERGGVTGALFDILSGGRDVGMEARLRKKGRR